MVNIEAEKIEVKKTMEKVVAAENRHDVEGMLDDMTDDAIFHVCGVPPMQGRDAVRALYGKFFETFVSTNVTTLEVEVSLSGDMAWEYGSYVNQFEGPDGRTQEEGKYLGVWKKVDGMWKTAAISISANG
jgi:uncharacterized protein (TIGR02246 family)